MSMKKVKYLNLPLRSIPLAFILLMTFSLLSSSGGEQQSECCPSECAIAESVEYTSEGIWATTAHGTAFYRYSDRFKFRPSRDRHIYACMIGSEDGDIDDTALCIFMPGTM